MADGNKNLLAAFKKSTEGSIGVTPIGKEEVQFNFSLNAFSAALASLDKVVSHLINLRKRTFRNYGLSSEIWEAQAITAKNVNLLFTHKVFNLVYKFY